MLTAAVIPLVLLASACGSSADGGGTANALDEVTIGGDAAKAPKLTLKTKPFTVKQTSAKVVAEGKGAALTGSNSISANYLVVNGRDGVQIESNFGKEPVNMDLSAAKLLPGLAKGLVGQKVGSRVLVAMPPADAFGAEGNAQLKVDKSDTILFLVQVISAKSPLTTAKGTAVAPKAGLPTVKIQAGKAAQITIPKAAPPAKLVVQPLIQGAGSAVKRGQEVKAAYTGVVWADGRRFDSSASEPVGYRAFPIGVGAVIPGWDKALVGQKVGSRLLIVVPPVEGYGTSGKPEAKIKGTDTLVFVVDILDAG